MIRRHPLQLRVLCPSRPLGVYFRWWWGQCGRFSGKLRSGLRICNETACSCHRLGCGKFAATFVMEWILRRLSTDATGWESVLIKREPPSEAVYVFTTGITLRFRNLSPVILIGKIFEGADWFHFTGIIPAVGPNLVETCGQACAVAKPGE